MDLGCPAKTRRYLITMMVGMNKLNVVQCLLIVLELVRSQEVTRRELHVCNNAGNKIVLNCTSLNMILVESAVIGTSDGWTAGNINCPRNDDTCVKRLTRPFDECNNKSTCSLPLNIIPSDLENGCQQTNYINITYVCIPATTSENMVKICGSSSLRQTSSFYVESYNFPDVMNDPHSCHCEINSTQQNDLTITAAYLKIGPISPNCGKENNSLCEEQLLLRKKSETEYDSNNRRSNTFLEMRNEDLLNATEFQRVSVSISFIKSSAEQYGSRYLLYVKSKNSVNIQCYNRPLTTIPYPQTSTVEINVSGKTTSSIISTDTFGPTTGKSTINYRRFTSKFYTPTTDGSLDSDQRESQVTCSTGCIAGIATSLVVAVIVVVLVVVLCRRRKKEAEEQPGYIVSQNDTVIVENTNYSNIDDLSSMNPASSSPGSAPSSPGPVMFSNPEYWDGNILSK